MSTATASESLTVRLVGGPTALLEIGGLRLLTDPTFDPPGEYLPRPEVHLTKTAGPAVSPEELGRVDVVLLSHDHHLDNLDNAGRAYLARVPRVLTTVSGADRLGDGATPMARWSTVEIERPGGGTLRVTGVPAQHGPDGTDHITGEVTGFVLSGDGLPTVYVSGDNASVDVVRRIVERVGPADIAVLHTGGAQMEYLGSAYLTLSGGLAAEATRVLGARTVVPIHHDGWKHFSEGVDAVRQAFAEAGLSDRLVVVGRGETATV